MAQKAGKSALLETREKNLEEWEMKEHQSDWFWGYPWAPYPQTNPIGSSASSTFARGQRALNFAVKGQGLVGDLKWEKGH